MELLLYFAMGLPSGVAGGYAAKVMFKIFLVAVGFVVLVDLALWYLGIISFHPEVLNEMVAGFVSGAKSDGKTITVPKVSAGFAAFLAGFAMGAYIAYKKIK